MSRSFRFRAALACLVLAAPLLLPQGLLFPQFLAAAHARNASASPSAATLPQLIERAERGDALAQLRLGNALERGNLGVPQNFIEAARWYRLAAEQGVAEAQFNLALMYRDGQGVSKSALRAHIWLNIAQSRYRKSDRTKRDLAVMLREGVSKRLTADEIDEAQRHAVEWQPKYLR